MKQILLSFAVVALVGGCHAGNKNMAEKAKAAILIEEAIRKAAKKPKGDLTKADYEKLKELSLGDRYLAEVRNGLDKLTQLTILSLGSNQLTDVTGLEKLTQLMILNLQNNPDLTESQIDQLQKALPECMIRHNAKLTKEDSAKVIEAAIREAAKKPTGELTKADYAKVTGLSLANNKLTDVKGLEKLTQLKLLHLYVNPDLTKAQIDELQKALPKCNIFSNPTK